MTRLTFLLEYNFITRLNDHNNKLLKRRFVNVLTAQVQKL